MLPCRVVLVPSPLTGRQLWAGVCDALWALDVRASVARIVDSEFAQPPYWLMHAASIAALLPEDGEVVLVAHSGASVLLPAIGRFNRNRSEHGNIAGYVFVDADLPRDGCSRFDLFDDADAAERMRAAATDGWLPRWTSTQLAPLIGDGLLRERFVADLPRVPLGVYSERIVVPDDWPDAPCGYLRLSDGYPSAVQHARRAGWAFEQLPGHHLTPLDRPGEVAARLFDLLAALVP